MQIRQVPFDREKHVFRCDIFAELVKDTVRFFNGTPVHPLPPVGKFTGTGIYAIYYTGRHEHYKPYSELNRLSYNYPIYVGKAVPDGWRKARTSDTDSSQSKELQGRLREHTRSIQLAELDSENFWCRFVIFENDTSDMIGTIEAALIKISRPIWNSVINGFGNHDPGSGRYKQAKSDWDVLHPGRAWAAKCIGIHKERSIILSEIDQYFKSRS